MITRDDIISLNDSRIERVNVPEWDDYIYVRVLTGTERDGWELSLQGSDSTRFSNVRARFVVLCSCNESGERVFKDSDVAMLGAKSALALDRIFQAGLKLNKVTDDDVKDIEKNYESALVECST